MADKQADRDVPSLDDGSEGSTLGYLSPGQSVLEESEEDPGSDEGAEELEEEEEETSDEGDEEDLDDDEGEPDDLEDRRKALEQDYTKKYRELSKKRGMIDMMEKIQADPDKMIPWLADQFGVKLVEETPRKGSDDMDLEMPALSELQVEKDEAMPTYINRVVAHGMQQLAKQLPKIIAGSMGDQRRRDEGRRKPSPDLFKQSDPVQEALDHLNDNYEDWPLYEDDMIAELKNNPQLIEDPDKLYKLGKKKSSVSTARVKSKTKKTSKRFSTGIRGSGKRDTQSKGGVVSFNEAWDRAKADVSKRR